MPFCPNCKTEYVSGTTHCADCDVELVDRVPDDVPVEYEECANCSESVDAESDFCVHCGVLFSGNDLYCERHPQSNAVAVCVICRRLMCDECAKKKGVKRFCEEHRNVEVSEDWAVAFQSVDYYEANIVRGKLESAGITVNPRNNTSIGFIADGFLEGPIGRSILKYPVKVFVPLDQYLEAVEIVSDELPPISS
ncbi:MAG TPA: zinc ribbon domain-containing protein [Bacteroidota bacterium]|nr:zinc ribbon domain-containing protein [Bacteroidota bacterium]